MAPATLVGHHAQVFQFSSGDSPRRSRTLQPPMNILEELISKLMMPWG
jgi:hypothetical protein